MKISKKDLLKNLQYDSLNNILKRASYPIVSARDTLHFLIEYKEEVIKILETNEVKITDE